MIGTFCERQIHPKKHFDKRSFRWKTSGKAKILIACPRGSWNARTARCRRGTQAYKILTPAGRRCPGGTRRLVK